MKDKFNRVMATGLLAIMIANFSACEQFGQSFNPGISTGRAEETNISETTGVNMHDSIYKPKDLPGDIWKAMKANGQAYSNYDASSYHLDTLPIPIKFLQEEGLLYYSNNKLNITDTKVSYKYQPSLFKSNIYIDENTDENDVYILLNYASDAMYSQVAEDVYITTWKLKYTLDDEDYQALLMLRGDFRQRFFIQQMDNIYEPEVISKCTYAQGYLSKNSPFRNQYGVDNEFPNVYIANIDYDTYTITMAAKSDNGYKFYDFNLEETMAIKLAMEAYGWTKEECLAHIEEKNVNTILGKCLINLTVGGYDVSLIADEAEKRFYESAREHKLTNLHVNSNENNFVAAK